MKPVKEILQAMLADFKQNGRQIGQFHNDEQTRRCLTESACVAAGLGLFSWYEGPDQNKKRAVCMEVAKALGLKSDDPSADGVDLLCRFNNTNDDADVNARLEMAIAGGLN